MTVAAVTIIPLALPRPARAVPATNGTGGPAAGCGRPAAAGDGGIPAASVACIPMSVVGTVGRSDTIDGGAVIDEAWTETSAGGAVELIRRRAP